MKRKPICHVVLNQSQYLNIQRYYQEYRKQGTVLGHRVVGIDHFIDVINYAFGCNKSERTLRRIWRGEHDITMFPAK